MTNPPVALITGVGPGTGTALAKRFGEGGYSVAMLARSKNRLDALEGEVEHSAGFVCDVSDPAALTKTVAEIESRMGAPEIVIHNAVGGAFGTYMDIDAETLEQNFRINTMALFHLARLTTPKMIEEGKGVLLCTGNTSAYRGKANFAGFAPTKAAQRILLESIAREVGPKGIHATFVAIDAVIDVPWTRARFSDKPDDFFCQPSDIADECFHLAHQKRSAWASELIIRPFSENW